MTKILLAALTLVYFTMVYIPHAEAAMTTLSDGESAEVMVTLNEGEIDIGQLAKRKATNKQVKDYAKMMVDQHKQNEKDTKKVVRKQDLDFKKTDMSKSFEARAEYMEKTLKKTSKEDFDRTYMSTQVEMHEKDLETVNTFINSAQNAAYKSHLEKTRDAITVHLAHAKEVQSIINDIGATMATTNTMPADQRDGRVGNNRSMQQTAPGDITTVNPMDPINDSRRANDSDMLTLPRRNRANAPRMPVSGTIEVMPR